jgi:hypothetical protein
MCLLLRHPNANDPADDAFDAKERERAEVVVFNVNYISRPGKRGVVKMLCGWLTDGCDYCSLARNNHSLKIGVPLNERRIGSGVFTLYRK